jgi:peptide/nickel transport system substrate-binding protein
MMASCTNHKISNKNIFRYNESAGISSLDPAFAKNQSVMWPINQLYNTLVELDSQLKVVPSLAKSWNFLNHNRTIVFRLRTDVYFHDDPVFVNGIGRKLVAADIVYSYNRLLDKRVASPGAWVFNDKIDSLHPFVAIDDSTFEIRLSSSCPVILGILSMPYCSIVPKEAVITYGQNFRSHPVGTGPFCFKVWEEGQALILKRNNRYFEKDEKGKKLPYLEGIKISFLDNKASEFVLFQQQELDFINDIDPSFKDELITKAGELKKQWVGKISMNKHSYLNTEYLGILFDTSNALLKNSPLRIKKVRLAINYAIDRKKMLM